MYIVKIKTTNNYRCGCCSYLFKNEYPCKTLEEVLKFFPKNLEEHQAWREERDSEIESISVKEMETGDLIGFAYARWLSSRHVYSNQTRWYASLGDLLRYDSHTDEEWERIQNKLLLEEKETLLKGLLSEKEKIDKKISYLEKEVKELKSKLI